MTEHTKSSKKKVVALLSGGLDSQLAVKMMQKQGFDVHALALRTPFCDFDCGKGCGFDIVNRAEALDVPLKTAFLGEEYIEMLKNPKYGRGAGFNPCIDCRAMMFDEAKKYMEEIGAEFIISGEVVGQRPMSQHRPALKTIEKESNLEGKIVRPLSAALLPKTDPEKDGLIKRKDLGMIRGRSRKIQLQMAKEFGVVNPPNAGGGCLLTDKAFGKRCSDLFDHTETPTFNDIDLLKVGRHFRLDEHTKLIVGRSKEENSNIALLVLPDDIILESKDYMGPTSMLRGKTADDHKEFAASVTLRYSDAPNDSKQTVLIQKNNEKQEIQAEAAQESSYLKFRI